jgi:hypothetical protein
MRKPRKIVFLRLIQVALDRGEQPRPLAVGLKEKEFCEMEDEGLFAVTRNSDTPTLANYRIVKICDNGLGLLAADELRKTSLPAKINQALWNGFLAFLKKVLGL